MVTAKKHIRCLQPVSNDATLTMLTGRRQGLNCAFEAVKIVRLSIFDDFQALVIMVATGLTCFHTLDAFCGFLKSRSQKLFVTMSKMARGAIVMPFS